MIAHHYRATAVLTVMMTTCGQPDADRRAEPHVRYAGLDAREVDSIAQRFRWDARYDSAAVAFAAAAATYAADGNWSAVVLTKVREGASHRDAGRYQQGLNVIEAADLIRRDAIPGEIVAERTTEVQLAISLIRLSRHREAIDLLSTTLEEPSAESEQQLVASIHQALGWAYQEIGRRDSSLWHLRQALSRLRDDDARSRGLLARTYNSIGINHYELNRPDSAILFYTRASDIRRGLFGENHPTYAVSIGNLALANRLAGNGELSVQQYVEATRIFTDHFGDRHPEVARCLTNLGLFYWEDGKLDLAQHVLDQALQMRIRTLGEDHSSLAFTYRTLANVALDKGDVSRAVDYANQALDVAAVTPEAAYDGSFETNLIHAHALEKLGEHGSAERAYGRTISELTSARPATVFPVAALNVHRARNLSTTTSSGRALRVLGHACEDLAGIGAYGRTSVYDCMLLRTKLLADQDSIATALDVLGRVRSRLESLSDIHPILAAKWKADADAVEGFILRRQYAGSGKLEHLQKAVDLLQRSQRLSTELQARYVGEQSKRALFGATAPSADSLIAASLMLYDRTRSRRSREIAFSAAERRRTGILVDVLDRAHVRQYAGVPDDMVRREAALRSSIVDYITTPGSGSNQGRRINQQILAHQALMRTIEREHPDFFALRNHDREYSIDEFRESLDDNEVVVEFAVLDERTVTFTLSRDTLVVGRALSSDSVRSAARTLRDAIGTQSYDDFAAAARSLYRLLIAPIEHLIEDRHLIIVPDGPLHFVPFEVLLTGDVPVHGNMTNYRELPYLIRSNPISYTFSVTMLRQLRNRAPRYWRHEFLGVAPVFEQRPKAGSAQRSMLTQDADSLGQHLRSFHLPGSLTEVITIRRSFGMNRLLGGRPQRLKSKLLLHDAASERRIKSLNLRDYRYIHFATHAFANESDPDLSGLVLAEEQHGSDDGVLHLREVYGLRLKADLVVLSACDTGLGRPASGEGIIGLTRGFLYAGASSVMVTLWRADDVSSSEIMVAFYKRLLRGRSQAEALQQAKLEVMQRSPVHGIPAYWAQFVVIGK